MKIPRRVFIDSDPVFTQLAIAKAGAVRRLLQGLRSSLHLRRQHQDAGERHPGGFTWHKTWQPVVTELWHSDAPPVRDRFTTVMTWKIESFTDVDGNKDKEFIKFIDLPRRTPHRFELAVNGPRACCASTAGTR